MIAEELGPRALIGDIGGTNARFALAGPDGRLGEVAYIPTAMYPRLEDAVAAFIEEHAPGTPLAGAAVCAAGPVIHAADGPRIQLTNAAWEVSAHALRRATGVDRPVLLNDFAALARGIPLLGPACLRPLGGGEARSGAPIAVLGPGTGLGVAALVPDGTGRQIVVTTEGGHADLAPGDERELQVFAELLHRFAGHVSAERVLSGPGLANIYSALGALAADPLATTLLEPAEVVTRAQGGQDPRAEEAVRLFTSWLGAFAGNLALTFGAFGGVYIAGGVTPRLGSLFDEDLFRHRFEAKGRLMGILEPIPVWLAVGGEPALRGLAEEAFRAGAAARDALAMDPGALADGPAGGKPASTAASSGTTP